MFPQALVVAVCLLQAVQVNLKSVHIATFAIGCFFLALDFAQLNGKLLHSVSQTAHLLLVLESPVFAVLLVSLYFLNVLEVNEFILLEFTFNSELGLRVLLAVSGHGFLHLSDFAFHPLAALAHAGVHVPLAHQLLLVVVAELLLEARP